MQKIIFLDKNDILTTVKLDGSQYKIRMLWNDSGGFWTMSLRTPENTSLLEGVKTVADYPLLAPYHRPGIPPGELMIITMDSTIQVVSRSDFANSKAVLMYITEAEVNAI